MFGIDIVVFNTPETIADIIFMPRPSSDPLAV